jgi:hypothetical protein
MSRIFKAPAVSRTQFSSGLDILDIHLCGLVHNDIHELVEALIYPKVV